jgi:release factor glutamine methyltransferase
MSPTTSDIIKQITERLVKAETSSESALNIAWWILEWATGFSRTYMLGTTNLVLNQAQEQKIERALYAYINEHMPLQYIFGTVPFLDLELIIRPPILIPRPETEYWCNLLITELAKLKNQKISILDLCTGTGCLGLSLAKAIPTAQVFAIDINPEAVQLARENQKKHHITNVTILESDLFQNISEQVKFDIIISNPPYISESEWKMLDPMVKKWEDPLALKATDNGYAIIERIIQEAPDWFVYNNEIKKALWIEIGHTQASRVRTLVTNRGFINDTVITDLNGHERVITAGLPACGFLINNEKF